MKVKINGTETDLKIDDNAKFTDLIELIKMSIDPSTKLIRRIVATTPQNKVYRFDFTGYGLNVRITDERFMYDPPSSINAYNNFLFQE